MAATLIGIFAVVALALAAIGVYGLISMHVSERTRELGIRMALGARRGDIVRLVLWRGVLLGIGGVLLGAIGGLVATRALQSLLFGVSPSDPVTLVWAALLLACVAVAASLVPACRAIRVDPMVVLRYE
jgi:ABC-type antimicrobial peptide transport system permease subunit